MEAEAAALLAAVGCRVVEEAVGFLAVEGAASPAVVEVSEAAGPQEVGRGDQAWGLRLVDVKARSIGVCDEVAVASFWCRHWR